MDQLEQGLLHIFGLDEKPGVSAFQKWERETTRKPFGKILCMGLERKNKELIKLWTELNNVLRVCGRQRILGEDVGNREGAVTIDDAGNKA